MEVKRESKLSSQKQSQSSSPPHQNGTVQNPSLVIIKEESVEDVLSNQGKRIELP